MTMRPRSEEAQKTLAKADKYTDRIEHRELRVKPESREFVGPSETLTMADMIANSMSQYKENKVILAESLAKAESVQPKSDWSKPAQEAVDQMVARVLESAQDFLRAIDKAWSYDLLEEGESVSRRLEDCAKERDDLKQQLQRVSTDYVKLQALYEDCQRKLHIHELGR
jgi:chromosome segregation ATPase